MENLTNLEILLLIVGVGQALIIYFMMGTIHKMKEGLLELKLINTRFYNMYMELSAQSLDTVLKWQKCIEDNKALLFNKSQN